MKKMIILQHNGGRLANQLWNYASIYAYALEKNMMCENPSFFRYAHEFKHLELHGFAKVYRYIPFRKLFTVVYNMISWLQSKLHYVIVSDKEFLLPPTDNTDLSQTDMLVQAKKHNQWYFVGWQFRNPEGLEKYQKEIKHIFTPKPIYTKPADAIVRTLRKDHDMIIGVHIRQGDYKTWQGGKYYVHPQEVAAKLHVIAKQYTKPAFIICSDEQIDLSMFGELSVVSGPGTALGDLYCLSLTDKILGSHSTYGPWAAYYGGIEFSEL